MSGKRRTSAKAATKIAAVRAHACLTCLNVRHCPVNDRCPLMSQYLQIRIGGFLDRVLAGVLGLLIVSVFPARGEVLWSRPDARLICQNGDGTDILQGAVKPQDDSSTTALYFKFRVDPWSDSSSRYFTNFEAGLVFYEGGTKRLGLGDARSCRAYSAFNAAETGPQNQRPGEFDFHSSIPEQPGSKLYEYPRRGVYCTIVFKVQYIAGGNDLVTVWLNPNLSPGNTENSQPTNLVTRFKANASFNELHLCHQGGGEGWWFSDLAVATSFEDFVSPHLWQKTWFISLTALLFLGAAGSLIFVLDRRRIQRLKHEQQRLEALRTIERERTRIARDIHDDLGATLSEIRLLSQFAQSPDSPQERVREDIKQIAAKALKSTQALDEIVWAVDPEADTIESFVNYAGTFVTDYLALAEVRCRLDLPMPPSPGSLRADVRHNLFLAFKESITNVVKHAAASEVLINMVTSDRTFTVTVTDNGRGIKPETLSVTNAPETRGHNGLANLRTRMASIGGQCEITSTPGVGTTVRLQILL